jgi:hypothetical protein
MKLAVPVGMIGEVHVPLLGRTASEVTLHAKDLDSNTLQRPTELTVWGSEDQFAGDKRPVWLLKPPRQETNALVMEVAAAELELVLSATC